MNLENKIYCHWDFVRLISEDKLVGEDGEFRTMSVSCGNKSELMIFLGKEGEEYEVRVYKNEPTDKYVQNVSDNVKSFVDNDEYATFFFDEYEHAQSFVDNLPYIHPEYRKRPNRLIEK